MSQEPNFNLNNLEKLMGNIPDNVKELFSSLMTHDREKEFKGKEFKGKEDLNHLEMLMQIKGFMDKFNHQNDIRVDLINALKPFLRPSRQYKIAQCIKAIKLSYFCKEASYFSMNREEKEAKGL